MAAISSFWLSLIERLANRGRPCMPGDSPRFDLYDGRSESPSLRQKTHQVSLWPTPSKRLLQQLQVARKPILQRQRQWWGRQLHAEYGRLHHGKRAFSAPTAHRHWQFTASDDALESAPVLDPGAKILVTDDCKSSDGAFRRSESEAVTGAGGSRC